VSETTDYGILPVLSELSPELLARLKPHCRIVDFADQELILRHGQENEHLHFVLEGAAAVHFNLTDRSEPIGIAAGQMFGEISVIDQMPVTANVIADGPCRILMVPAAFFWTEIVTVPGVAGSVMRHLSKMLRANSGVVVRAMQERLRHQAFERELGLARDIQMGMMRHPDPWFPDRSDVQVAAFVEPAKLVGGDFYDAFLLDNDRLVLSIGDVAGKGISAALFMMQALTLLRRPGTHWHSLADTVADTNRVLAAGNDSSMFLTLFMAELDLRTGVLNYVNFGHPKPLLRMPDGTAAFQDVRPGVIFGLVPDGVPASGQINLPPGAALLVYSDGVTEAEDVNQRQFGREGLASAVKATATTDPEAVVGAVKAAIAAHTGDAEQSDDITLMAVTWFGAAGR
jgi:serine phosphatase RsbU (regulator of sigma subunit)